MKPISTDLRVRILADSQAGMATAAVAAKYSVSTSFVRKLRQQQRETGSIEPLPHGGGRERMLKDRETEIRALMTKDSDQTLEALKTHLKVACSLKTLWMELRRLGYRLKKSR
jgi:transposase